MIFNTMSQEKIGELVGIFAGDGNYTLDRRYHHQIRIFLTLRDSEYIKHVCKLLEFICNKKPSLYKRSSDNVAIIRIISVDLLNFLRKYVKWDKKKTETICLIKNPRELSRGFMIGFLRGLMDTDGYIDMNGVARFSTVSSKLARNIEKSLKKLKIDYVSYLSIDKRKNRRPISRIVIRRDSERFMRIVKPEHFSYLYLNRLIENQARIV